MTKTLLVVNPTARAGHVSQIWKEFQNEILNKLGRNSTEVAFTTPEDHGSGLIRRALLAGTKRIVVMGGDGSLSEAIQGFLDNGHPIASDATLGILPSGRGDDFFKSILDNKAGSGARASSIPGVATGRSTRNSREPHAAPATGPAWRRGLDLLTHGAPQPLDIGLIQWLYADSNFSEGEQSLSARQEPMSQSSREPKSRAFLNIASFGYPGLVVQRVQNRSSFLQKTFVGKSALTYTVQGALTLAQYRALPVSVKLDGRLFYEGLLHAGFILNGRFNAGGICWDSDAKWNDGRFHLVILDGKSKGNAIANTLYTILSKGGHASRNGLYRGTGKQIEIRFMLDGISRAVERTENRDGISKVPSHNGVTKPHPLFEIDGDIPEPTHTLGAMIEVIPGAIQVVGPAR